jgi:hypothetical protein
VRAALLIFGLVGCDQLFGLQHLRDARIDASSHACAGRDPAPTFCGDFDESTQPKFYVDGVGTTTGFPQDGTVTVGPQGTTGNAITFASTGTDTFARYRGGFPMLSLDATFAIKIPTTNPANGSTGLVLMSIAGSTDCYAGLDVEEDIKMIELAGSCGGAMPNISIAPIPSDFVTVELTFSVATGVATLSIDHGPLHTIDYGVLAPEQNPVFELGIHSAGHAGLTVVYDDITVTGSDVM